MPTYIPRKGDYIAVTFDPPSGHEQKGRRPALVVSNDAFNRHTGLAMVCPITNARRGYPFHVPIPGDATLAGVVMVEQVTSIDFGAREARRISRAAPGVHDEVLSLLDACIY